MNGKRFELQAATGYNFNCLIDTLRQSLELPFSPELLDNVRNALAKEFPRGDYQVQATHHPNGPNYLEFLEHTRSVARLLLQKSGVQGQRHEDLKFVCVDLDLEKFSVLDAVGTMQREIVFVRENRNHFIPVLPSEIPREMLLPWNIDIGFIQAQRRKKKEAAELAERRKREEAAAQLERVRRQKEMEEAAAAKKRKAEQEAAAAAEAEKRRKAEAAAAEETPALGDDIFSLNGIDVGQVGKKSISASKAAAAEVEKLRRQKLGIDVGEVVKNSTSASNEDAVSYTHLTLPTICSV